MNLDAIMMMGQLLLILSLGHCPVPRDAVTAVMGDWDSSKLSQEDDEKTGFEGTLEDRRKPCAWGTANR